MPQPALAAPSSSVLFASKDRSVVLVDIPRSLEEGQVPPGHAPTRRVYSGPPPPAPLPTPEPSRHRRHGSDGRGRGRGAGGAAHVPSEQSPAAQLADLMTAAAVESALRLIREHHHGPFHLPRLAASPAGDAAQQQRDPVVELDPKPAETSSSPSPSSSTTLVPPGARYIHGMIQASRQLLLDTAPQFQLIVLDPPWPNRSARRRRNQGDRYATAATMPQARDLLAAVPVAAHLAPDGLVAVWITNKARAAELLTAPATGLFAAWGLEPAVEWTWLKVAASGEPLYPVDSQWRKPWERLLVAKRRGARTPPGLAPKVLVACPDVHSRKPSLRCLFEDVLGRDYVGLEVFARNLTAGWWSWGDQVLQFQDATYWEPVTGQEQLEARG
ncbi:hypothetical protein JDV02_000215 [Purpureocillium takamizusanense]|uniref:MT-A70 family n=1 Tax=Purpureocillium takamizusanense TaxID=2060973 RepID=A0A9Q8V659_9HYPO|nr:uncharacterized protein JDV02_000215 [Purpureocillium takamizusanense]UNI13472.1 hypothetical protein JDV02_000215 [Purpureocillium takamizusanense]